MMHMTDKKKMRIIIIILIIICALGGIGFGKSKLDSFLYGSEGNSKIVFPALSILNGEWVYYVDSNDEFLYKIKNDEKIKLSNEKISNIGIIVFEDRLYFINKLNKKLYSINLSGEDKRIVDKCNVIMPYQPMFKLRRHIYYYDSKNVLVRIDSKGTHEKIVAINEPSILYKITDNSLINRGFLYTWDDRGLYKTTLNSGKCEKLCNDFIYDKIQIVNGNVYYINNNDLRLYKVNINSKRKTCISTDKVIEEGTDFDSGNFYVYGNNMFYTFHNDIIRLDINKRIKSIVVKGASYFTISGNKIYYMDRYDKGGLYKVKINKGVINKVAQGDFIPYIQVWGDFIFYGLKDDNINENYLGKVNFKKII